MAPRSRSHAPGTPAGATATLARPGSALSHERLTRILETARMREIEDHLARAYHLDEKRWRKGLEQLVRDLLDDVAARYASEMGAHIDAIVEHRKQLGEIVNAATRGTPPVEDVDVLLDGLRGHLDALRDLPSYVAEHPPQLDPALILALVGDASGAAAPPVETGVPPGSALAGPDRPADAASIARRPPARTPDPPPGREVEYSEPFGPMAPLSLKHSRQRGEQMLDWGREVLEAWRSGETLEPEGVKPVDVPWTDHPLLHEHMGRIEEAMAAYQRADHTDPGAAFHAVDVLRRVVSDGNEILRSFGHRFDAPPADARHAPIKPVPSGAHLQPGSAAADAVRIRDRLTGHRRGGGRPTGPALQRAPAHMLFDAMALEDLEVTASGRLGEPLDRRLPGMDASKYARSVGQLAKLETQPTWLAARLAELVKGWQRAHLVGPGFGGELFAGLMLAPEGVNQVAQNQGVEDFLRRAADWRGTGDVAVQVTARGRRLAIPLQDGSFEDVDVLSSVRYEIPRRNGPPLVYEILVAPNGKWRTKHNLPSGAPGARARKRGSG